MVVNGPPVVGRHDGPSLARPGSRTDARMTIDLDEGAERDDLTHPHLLTPTKRLHAIAQILAKGIQRQREDARRMGETGNISARQKERKMDLNPRVRVGGLVNRRVVRRPARSDRRCGDRGPDVRQGRPS